LINTKDNGDGTVTNEAGFRFGLGFGGGGAYDKYGTISEQANRGDEYIARTVFEGDFTAAIAGIGQSYGIKILSGNALNEEDNNKRLSDTRENPCILDATGKTGGKLSAKAVVELLVTWEGVKNTPVTNPRDEGFVDEKVAP
jgi:hypothetical protein